MTYVQNDKWLDSLSDITKDKQLTMLNERMLSDTNVFVRPYYPDRIKVDEKCSDKVYGDGKPILIVNKTFISIDNNTPTYKIIALTKLLNKDGLSTIIVLKGREPATQALYGSNGRSGVIIMNAKKRNLLKN